MSEAITGVPAAKASVRTMPKLSPPSEGAHSTSASARARRLRSSPARPRVSTPRGSTSSGASSASVAPTICRRAGTCSRSASKARSSTARPLRSTACPTKTIRSSDIGRRRGGRQRQHLDAVGDHAVVAAVEAPAGPGRGLGDGDPHAQAVEQAPGAEQVGDVVGDAVLRVAVEGADQRRAGRGQRVPAQRRRHRLVQVDHVEAARPQLVAHGGDGVRGDRQVGDRPVGRRSPPCGPARSGSRAPGAPAARRRGADQRARRSAGSWGASTRTSWPSASSCSASPSMWLVTPPG